MIASDALILLDTNIVLHMIRGNPIGQRIDSDHQLRNRSQRPLISIVTVGELRALALKLGWGESKRDKLSELLRELVIVELERGDIIGRYAVIDDFSEKRTKPARPMGQNDMWIAATVAATGAWLFTTDNDFDHLAPQFIHRIKLDPKTGATITSD